MRDSRMTRSLRGPGQETHQEQQHKELDNPADHANPNSPKHASVVKGLPDRYDHCRQHPDA